MFLFLFLYNLLISEESEDEDTVIDRLLQDSSKPESDKEHRETDNDPTAPIPNSARIGIPQLPQGTAKSENPKKCDQNT